jgi:hypothetical protein
VGTQDYLCVIRVPIVLVGSSKHREHGWPITVPVMDALVVRRSTQTEDALGLQLAAFVDEPNRHSRTKVGR